MFSMATDRVDQGMKGRTGHLDDWVAETPESIAARLESARNSQAQARRTMGVMSIISMMMLVASYNAYLSYDSTWILELTRKQFDMCCRRSRLYSEATGRVLREYGGRLRADLLRHQAVAS